MPTAIGQNTLTSVARHFIMPRITDNIYTSNVMLYRLMKGNKRMVQGGTQIEVPLMYRRFTSGGPYRGYQVLDTTPQDTIKNGVLDWKQQYVPWAVDGLTLIMANSDLAIANILDINSTQARMEMAENLAVGLFGDGLADPIDLDGLRGMVGNAAVGNPNYAGINRAANPWWNATVDAVTAALVFGALQTGFGLQTVGGNHPTIYLSRQEQYNRFIALHTAAASGYTIQHIREPLGSDEMLMSAGFTNALFNNVPWVVDSHVDDGPNAANSRIYALNETMLTWVVSPRADFYLEDFQKPTNQDAYSSMLLWAGNILCMNCRTQGVFTNISA